MKIAVDFDGTLVDDGHAYDDLVTPLRLMPGAREALQRLREAGHVLVLVSGRANRALRVDWRLNPLWVSGAVPFRADAWAACRSLNEARYQQMLAFVDAELPGLFHAVDDGGQGKVSADVYFDDRARPYRGAAGLDWPQFADRFAPPGEEVAS